ncbi:hypothetical protein Poli38472_011090 [Pythium oligandrum]|uniref:Uncharacterized protein n=1 Tax=Pythium oligandrum TaxID=41045 RepID=A0A8K1FKT3_PYTOL|nr:hypothetical protein Poli38472_011090 [Pythium oligandrum]|eukprot:TMW67470.1 hypothetical protein Poli38472_011090 [Pythium oligandrum]
MRWVQSLVVFSALGRVAVSTESQWIVIGTNGRIVDVDPTPYMPENRRRRALDPVLPPVVADRVNERDGTSMETSDLSHSEVKGDVESVLVPSEDLSIFDDEDGEDDVHESRLLHNVFIPDVETLAKELKEQQKLQEWEDEEMEMELEATDTISPSVSLTAPPSQLLSSTYESKLSPLFDAITLLREEDIQGSVLFAELSCLFVVFIGYLVHTIPLWTTFSRGQKGCLYMAYSVAAIYQFVALAWYMNFVSHQHFSLVNVLITVLLVGGELPMIGAFLFSAMLVFTPHLLQRLYKSRDAMFAGLLALFSAIAYHLVCLRWYHAQLHTTQLVIVAPFCQFVLCVAMGMLYAVAMECYHHAHALDPGYSGYEVTSSLRARCY